MTNVKLYKLTNPQKTIWYTEQFYKGSTVNNIGGFFSIDEEINFDLLKEATLQFVKDNDAFRIKLCYDENGEIKQYFSEFKEFDIPLINLINENELNSLKEKTVGESFSLIDENLFKFIMYRFPNNKGGLLLVAHHIIYDAFTASLTASKIINNYSDLKNGRDFTEKSTSYLNYIEAENNYLNSEKFNKDKEYWNKIYETVPEIANIPSIKPESENTSKAKRKTFIIDKNFNEKINEFCSNNKISPFNFFMGLYAIYIGRVSNLDDFVIGTPILNRSNFEEKNTPGMFISTLALRLTLNNELSFIDFAKKIATDSFSAFRHQKYSYQNILDDIRKTNPNQPNLYDVLISYQNARTNRNSSDIPYRVEWFFNNNVADNMQIHLSDLNDEGSLNVSYDYRVNKYDDKDIDAIHSRIIYMINQVLSKEDINLDKIEIVTPKEKDIILNKFNDTNKKYSIKNSIIEMIEETAKQNPNVIAIESQESSITYSELLVKINKLSNYLLKQNIKSNSNIGIFTTRTIDTIIGILACLKINCTYVPIDIEYPIDRITYMIKTSNIKCILSENVDNFDIISNLENIKKIGISSNVYNSENADVTNKFEYDYNTNLYIIFTSGSTGKPKGVTISHKNILNLMLFEKNETSILKDAYNKILQFATMSFDVSYQEIYSALLFGNTLVLIDEESRKDMNKLSNYISNKGITTLFIPPAYLKLLVENKDVRELIKNSVKNIITAGEALVITEGIRDLIESGITVHNHYGPAETHVATAYTITEKNITSHPPIGKPISNSYIHIFDKNNMLSPIGVIGEIIISGDCVGNGYFDNKELTDHRFKINPYNNKIMYYTGDLGFYDYEGNVHFIGRSDFQVKLNGFRVELDEIDQVLLKHENIKNSISVIHEENGKKYIITYYTENKETVESDLLKYLGISLPFYMIPKKLVRMDNLPINNNGKIDRKKLPKIILSDIEDNFVEPQTETEIKLAEIWKNIFNVDKIGANYNFFNIGGDSLLAIKLSAIIQSKLGIEVSVSEIYADPTLSKLAILIDNKINIQSNLENSSKIQHCDKKDYYKLSSAQKRIYYASKVSGDDSCLYNMPGVIIFDTMPDIDKLNECFNKIIKRHSSLRTSFEIVNDEVCQKISEEVNFKIDIKTSNKSDINEIVKDFVKPFNLEQAPLLRAQIINLKDKVLLLFDMHHIISDGLSLSILTKELCKLYNDEKLEPLSLEYVDYSEWENNNIKENKLENSKEFWVNQFKDEIPVLNMPTDHARPAVQSFNGSKVYSTISKTLTEKVNKLSKDLNVSNYMLLLACYYILLSKYTMQEDIIVGTPVIGRNKDELLNMIGMFVNSMPLKNHIDSSISFIDFLNTIKQNTLKALEHQDYPFDELVNQLNIERDTSRSLLFDTMFIYQNDGFAPVNFNGLNSKLYIPDANISKYDLSLEIVPTDDELRLNFEYATSLYNKDTIERFAGHYINILQNVVDNTNVKIADIDMLSKKERNQILNEFNNTYIDYEIHSNYIDLFKKQVQKTPNKTAIVFHDKKLTYKELDEKSNQIANFLIKNGVKNNEFVGLLVNRSLELITAMIGILKAGAGYLPIDPTYPDSRIQYMIDDSKVKIILSQKNLIEKLELKNAISIGYEDSSIYSEFNKDYTKINILSNNYAYLIYTSGSTGKPKGVIINHQNINNFIAGMCREIDFSEDKTIVSITTMCFDIFGLETLLSLQKGLTIVLADEDEQVNPRKLNSLCLKYNVDIIQTTPSKFSLLIADNNELEYVKKLDSILLGGEAFPQKMLSELKSITKAKIYNVYGPTETTIWSSVKYLSNTDNITIGKPIANTQMYILDNNKNVMPIGLPGELYIGGDGISVGYYNKEELTNERFIDNPFIENKKIYKTGDLVKWLPSGEIEYIGRTDFQVKLHGLRIELGEIESAILKYPNIENCVVCVKNTSTNRQLLCGYIIANNKIFIPELKKYLSNILPTYMVPTYIMQLDKFKYTPNSKIDRNALPIPDLTDTEENKYIAPTNDLEMKLVKIYEKVLSISSIGIEDNFFKLGGDSILAVTLQIELMKQNINISYADIYLNPTILELEKKITSTETSIFKNIEKNEFTEFNNVLNNICKFPKKIEKIDIKNVIITGTTGFLGAHVLEQFLKNEKGIAYCFVRQDIGIDLKEKFLNKLHYYFGNKYDNYIGTRIIIVNAEISQINFGMTENDLDAIASDITCIINCAAKVSHFGNYNAYKEINVDGTEHLLKFAQKYNKRFYQISTISVSGNSFVDQSYIKQDFEHDIIFRENDFYINQSLENVYVRSKFEAEKLVLQYINKGLNAYILRVGNLMNRYEDGKFQPNVEQNAYVMRLISLSNIGCIPEYLINGYLEFTPIDSCANAIIKLIQHPTSKNRIFHLFNHNHIDIKDFISNIKQYIDFDIVSNEEFELKINKIMLQKNADKILSGILRDFDSNKKLIYESPIKIKSDFTIAYLNDIGFKWPIIDEQYIKQFLEYYIRLGYLKKKGEN